MTEDQMTAQAFDEEADDLERIADELRRKARMLRFGVEYQHQVERLNHAKPL